MVQDKAVPRCPTKDVSVEVTAFGVASKMGQLQLAELQSQIPGCTTNTLSVLMFADFLQHARPKTKTSQIAHLQSDLNRSFFTKV